MRMYYPYFDPIGFVFHVLAWAAFIMLIIWLVRGSRHHRHMRMRDMRDLWKGNRALDLLKERYAKGEITKEQFDEMKQVIDN